MEEQREPLVLINAFEVPPDKDDEFIRGWEGRGITSRVSRDTSVPRFTVLSPRTPISAS